MDILNKYVNCVLKVLARRFWEIGKNAKETNFWSHPVYNSTIYAYTVHTGTFEIFIIVAGAQYSGLTYFSMCMSFSLHVLIY